MLTPSWCQSHLTNGLIHKWWQKYLFHSLLVFAWIFSPFYVLNKKSIQCCSTVQMLAITVQHNSLLWEKHVNVMYIFTYLSNVYYILQWPLQWIKETVILVYYVFFAKVHEIQNKINWTDRCLLVGLYFTCFMWFVCQESSERWICFTVYIRVYIGISRYVVSWKMSRVKTAKYRTVDSFSKWHMLAVQVYRNYCLHSATNGCSVDI